MGKKAGFGEGEGERAEKWRGKRGWREGFGDWREDGKGFGESGSVEKLQSFHFCVRERARFGKGRFGG